MDAKIGSTHRATSGTQGMKLSSHAEPVLNKQSILHAIVPLLHADSRVIAAWLGGSDATSRADALSDIDLCIVAGDGDAKSVLGVIENSLSAISPISAKFELPEPTWHGFSQSFFQLQRAPEYLMIDCVVVERSQPNPWMEVERHGKPCVLFDKEGLLRESHVDRTAMRRAAEKRIAELRHKFPMFRHLPVKLARRGQPIDALHFYNALVLRPLIDLLRAIYCPERYDFGPRYLKDDLPRQYEDLCRLSFVRSLDDYDWMVELAGRMFDAALRKHDSLRM